PASVRAALGPTTGAGHGVAAAGGGRLAGITGESGFTVKSYHHQAVKKVGKGLMASATAPDGIVEGIESGNDSFVLGIQWHPERDVADPISRKIFESFIEECRK